MGKKKQNELTLLGSLTLSIYFPLISRSNFFFIPHKKDSKLVEKWKSCREEDEKRICFNGNLFCFISGRSRNSWRSFIFRAFVSFPKTHILSFYLTFNQCSMDWFHGTQSRRVKNDKAKIISLSSVLRSFNKINAVHLSSIVDLHFIYISSSMQHMGL